MDSVRGDGLVGVDHSTSEVCDWETWSGAVAGDRVIGGRRRIQHLWASVWGEGPVGG